MRIPASVLILGGISVSALAIAIAKTDSATTAHDAAVTVARNHGEVRVLQDRVSVKLLSPASVNAVVPLLKNIEGLVELKISNVNLDTDTLKEIGTLTSIKSLWLEGCFLEDDDLLLLQNLTGLSQIWLTSNPLENPDIRYLSKMKSLRILDLSFSNITGEGLQSLVTCDSLETLRLTGTLVDDATVTHCAKLKSLRHLSLGETSVTEKGILQIVDMVWLEKLGLPNGIPRAKRYEIRQAFIDARKAARAAGKDVPANDNGPF